MAERPAPGVTVKSAAGTYSAPLFEAYAGAARVVAQVLGGRSLTAVLGSSGTLAGPTRAAIHHLVYQALRADGLLDQLLDPLLQRPPREALVHALLVVALADLRGRPDKAYVAVDQAVRAARVLDCHPAAGLINAVLRNYLRRAESLEAAARATDVGRWQHPQWWIDLVRADHPDSWMPTLDAGNGYPPMTVRINTRRTSVAQYQARLAVAGLVGTCLGGVAIRLDRPVPVQELPGFAAGLVSVQDSGAQRAPGLLGIQPGQRVLDACAAPGGKAAHLLERYDCVLTALDRDRARAARITEGYARLGLSGEVIVADAIHLDAWWNNVPFDHILLDAPCSASGIVRRHPDIKWHRRASDLDHYAAEQSALLDSLWRTLVHGGTLLYATCSVFSIENEARIEAFLGAHDDAIRRAHPLAGQLLPTDMHDGFFYALLEKR